MFHNSLLTLMSKIYNVTLADDGRYTCDTIGTQANRSRHVVINIFQRDSSELDYENSGTNLFQLDQLSSQESRILGKSHIIHPEDAMDLRVIYYILGPFSHYGQLYETFTQTNIFTIRVFRFQ